MGAWSLASALIVRAQLISALSIPCASQDQSSSICARCATVGQRQLARTPATRNIHRLARAPTRLTSLPLAPSQMSYPQEGLRDSAPAPGGDIIGEVGLCSECFGRVLMIDPCRFRMWGRSWQCVFCKFEFSWWQVSE